MKVPNNRCAKSNSEISLSRLQNEGSQQATGRKPQRVKSIKATE